MRKSKLLAALWLILAGFASSALADIDTFSRANCFNNESISYSYEDPAEWRAVFSWHFDNNTGQWAHYVTENPLAFCDIYTCYYYFTLDNRHAGVHGAFLSSEPNPDGVLTPGVTSRWQVTGVHKTLIPGVAVLQQVTNASDCNLHFNQFY